MSTKLYLYPVWLRIWHGINAILFLMLIATGVSMQYSSVDTPLIRFDLAVSLHNIAGVILSLNYLLYLIGNFSTGNIKFYKLKIAGFYKHLQRQLAYYILGTFKGEHTPYPVTEKSKFNPLQKITYIGVMFTLVPMVIISGIALLYPEMIVPQIGELSGIYITALFHGLVGTVLALFMIVHIYFCTMGSTPTSNFKSMINGYHEPHD